MMTPLTMPFDMILEVLASAVRQEKAIQGVHIEEKKIALFIDDKTNYIENLKELTKFC